MRFRFVSLLIVVLFALPAAAQNTPEVAPAAPSTPVTVEGRLLAAAGTPLANAYVSPTGLGMRERLFTDDDGRFTFTVERPGGYHCWFVAPKHKTVTVPLLIRGGGDISIEVRLETADYVESIDNVSVIGDFNGFDREEGLIPMTKQGDGTWRASIPTDADTLAYQLMGVHDRDYPLSGTQSGRLVFNPDLPLLSEAAGNYNTVIPARDGAAEVVFDPSLLPRSNADMAYRCSDATAERIIAWELEFRRIAADHRAAYIAYTEAGGNPSEMEYDWNPVRARIAAWMDGESDPTTRAHLLLGYFRFSPVPVDSMMARRVLDDVAPDSPLWSLLWGGPANLWMAIARFSNQDERTADYAAAAAATHADADVRAAFVYYLMTRARRLGDTEAHRRYYLTLTGEYPDTWLADMARRSLAPDLKIKAGNPLPDFSLPSMADVTTVITRESLRGRVYLIDFWAVWCGPCVAEMDNLHEVYECYKDRGFTIVSISLDRKPQHVDEFRRERWPMPWLHTYVAWENADDLRATFEVGGIPRPILVGKDGTILAEGRSLRGEVLGRTVGDAMAGDAADDSPR